MSSNLHSSHNWKLPSTPTVWPTGHWAVPRALLEDTLVVVLRERWQDNHLPLAHIFWWSWDQKPTHVNSLTLCMCEVGSCCIGYSGKITIKEDDVHLFEYTKIFTSQQFLQQEEKHQTWSNAQTNQAGANQQSGHWICCLGHLCQTMTTFTWSNILM